MKFFIDTANLKEIKEASDMGILDGVTTNPSLMAKEGIKGNDAVIKTYIDICEVVQGPVSAEVISTDFDGIVREGEHLASLHEHIVVKVPMIKEGIKAIKYLNGKGIKTNCTLVFSPGQAILAAKAGATYVSPFMGRLDDINYDGVELVEQIVYIYDNYGYTTEVLAASVRSPLHIIRVAEAGADVVTAPFSALVKLFDHPLTDKGLAQFLSDYKKVQEAEKSST
ncbi:MAG: fructose-6-phosphate aldolase [Chitinophagales bacterium]|nr:fructose-6-phosphate aldolase [Chitinophagales bacterium]